MKSPCVIFFIYSHNDPTVRVSKLNETGLHTKYMGYMCVVEPGS